LAQQRAHGGSPYRKLAGPGEIVACYVNADWGKAGIAAIKVLKRVPGGHAMAAFLIDLWCIGLKDAFGRLDILPSEFNKSLDRARDSMEIARIDPAVALRLIRGSIRFARQNGFRLPPKYDRWVSLLGEVGDCSSADLSDFGIDGGLRYVGTMEDLRERLIGCTVEQFVSREDVHYIIGGPAQRWPGTGQGGFLDDEQEADDPDDAGENDNDPDEQANLHHALRLMRARALEAARQWCVASEMQPHPRLEEAVDTFLGALGQAGADCEEQASDEDLLIEATDSSARIVSAASGGDEGLAVAIRQLAQFANRFDSPEAFLGSLGLVGSG